MKDVSPGETVLVYRRTNASGSARLYTTARIGTKGKRQFSVSGYGEFSLATGERPGGRGSTAEVGYFVRRATAEELAAAEKQLRDDDQREQAEEEAARRAAYDALPEGVKLARKLEFFASCSKAETIAEVIPLETLRAAVAAIEAAGKDTE